MCRMKNTTLPPPEIDNAEIVKTKLNNKIIVNSEKKEILERYIHQERKIF